MATGIKTTIKQLLDIMFDIYKKKLPIEIKEGTPGDVFGIVGDISRFNKISGFNPKVNLREGLKIMFSWATNKEEYVLGE